MMAKAQRDRRVLVWVGVLCMAAVLLPAQEKLTENTVTLAKGGSVAPATIKDVAWLYGRWGGAAFGGRCEETWSKPKAGAMIGMYRLLNDHKPVFYELMSLSEEEGGLLLRIKHFNPDLTGWEEKETSVEFPLVSFTATTLHFRGLTFRRISTNEIAVYLAMRLKDGSFKEETFTYRRLDAPAPSPSPPPL